jgi:predicted dienelactone hydrolase
MNYNFFAGYAKEDIEDLSIGVKFPMHIFYPSDTPETPEKLGPFSLNVALNSAPKDGIYPLVIFSHGSGSMPLLFRTLGQYLARHGFVVGLPEHPFNNRDNNSAVDTVENLVNRPKHLQVAIDWFFNSSILKSILIPDSVSLIGHSMGGYTVLALAGGEPTPLPHEIAITAPLAVNKDHRINAIVLLAPATVWFLKKEALNSVDVPILMLTAELDRLTPAQPHARIVLENIANPMMVTHKKIENAGHFSFMSAYPDELKSLTVPPSQDPKGFDRQAFLNTMYVEITDFLLLHKH